MLNINHLVPTFSACDLFYNFTMCPHVTQMYKLLLVPPKRHFHSKLLVSRHKKQRFEKNACKYCMCRRTFHFSSTINYLTTPQVCLAILCRGPTFRLNCLTVHKVFKTTSRFYNNKILQLRHCCICINNILQYYLLLLTSKIILLYYTWVNSLYFFHHWLWCPATTKLRLHGSNSCWESWGCIEIWQNVKTK